MARVVLGLSGGVDSSVAAHLLLEQGHEVIGLFMRNWHDDTVILDNECPWIEDSNDALLVAEQLGIPFQVVDLSEAYRKRIVEYMFAEYEKGRTPNPDVLCNREIKFDIFLDTALKLGADYVATGHYCQRDEIQVNGQTVYRLQQGADPNKDQSYFLCQLNQFQLSKALFPIGHLQKPQVRKLAEELGLATAEKKDSQGLCFVGKVSLPTFLQQQLKVKKGPIVEIPAQAVATSVPAGESADPALLAEPFHYTQEMGKVVGEHSGAHFFTIGQRKGLQVGGMKEPLFVLASDTEQNILYVGQGEHHPGLYRDALFMQAPEVHWIREDLRLNPGGEMRVEARIRYRQPLQAATLMATEKGHFLIFDNPQKSITPGQFAAWYQANELVGSGVIHA